MSRAGCAGFAPPQGSGGGGGLAPDADLLDGQDGAYYLARANHTGTQDHGATLTGLGDDDHAQYALLAGRAGGQTAIGGTAASEGLRLRGTSHATPGFVAIDRVAGTEIARYGLVGLLIGKTTSTYDYDLGNRSLELRSLGTVASQSVFLRMEAYGDLAQPPEWSVLRSGGTPAAPTVVSDGTQILSLNGTAQSTTTVSAVGQVRLEVDGAPGAGITRGRWVWLTAGAAGVQTEAMRINSAQQILSISGSAATPAVAFISDTDTGSFNPAANTYAIATGGVERLRIDSSGSVSVTTAGNQDQLKIRSTASNAGLLLNAVDAGGAEFVVSSKIDGRFQVHDNTSGNTHLQMSNPADGETTLLLRRNVAGVFALVRVSMGAVDSGGAGFKLLRVPN